jgi:hypothetical protein
MERKTKKIHYGLIALEVTAFLIVVLFIWWVMPKTVRDDVDMEELSTSVLSALGEQEGCAQADAMGLRKYYGLDANDYEDVLLYLPSSNMDAAELLLVVMKDEDQAEAVLEAMNSRLEQQKKAFEGYGVEQMGILNQAVVCVEGRYGLLAVCENADGVKSAFDSVIEEK